MTLIDSTTSRRALHTQAPFILVLKTGESLHDAILHCANNLDLQSAIISGLGKVNHVTIAFYNKEAKRYDEKLYKGPFELVSLNGNITFLGKERFLHIHVGLSDEKYQMIGGHLMDAKVAETAEISITPLPEKIMRAYDDKTGLKLMCPSS